MNDAPADPQRLSCRYCSAALVATDVNVQLGIASCASCHAVYSLVDQAQAHAAPPPERPVIALPKGYQVERTSSGLTLTRSWYSPAAYALLVFCVFWDGFLVVWYSIALSAGQAVMAIFATLHLVAGLFLTYTMLTRFFNKSTIAVMGGRLLVTHGPLPVPGKLELPSAALAQLWCVERVHRSKNGTSRSFEVHARTKDGHDHVVLKGLEQPAQALYVEQQIERHLRIADRPIAGQLDRT